MYEFMGQNIFHCPLGVDSILAQEHLLGSEKEIKLVTWLHSESQIKVYEVCVIK